jgi:hypothetical protein
MFVVNIFLVWYTLEVKYFIIFKEEIKMKNLAKAGICALALTAAFSFAGADSVFETDTGANYDVDFSGLSEDEVASITKIVAEISCTSNYLNGSVGGNVDGSWTATTQQEISADSGAASGSFTWEFSGSLVNIDDDGNLAPFAQVQIWWINPIYDEDGNAGDNGVATIDSLKMYDKDGNVVKELPAQPVVAEVGEKISADNNYSISSEVYGAAASADLDLYFSSDVWNDWCQGLIVVEANDTTTYYLLKGASANWNLTIAEDEDGNKTVVPYAADATVGKGETAVDNFVVVDITGAGQEQTVSVDLANAENWKITFYSPAWNNSDGTADDIDGTSQDLSANTEPYVYAVNKITVNPATASSTPSEETPAANDSVTTPSDAEADNNANNDNNSSDDSTGASTTTSPKTGDATPVAAIAILAVVALAGVVVTKKARA